MRIKYRSTIIHYKPYIHLSGRSTLPSLVDNALNRLNITCVALFAIMVQYLSKLQTRNPRPSISLTHLSKAKLIVCWCFLLLLPKWSTLGFFSQREVPLQRPLVTASEACLCHRHQILPIDFEVVSKCTKCVYAFCAFAKCIHSRYEV